MKKNRVSLGRRVLPVVLSCMLLLGLVASAAAASAPVTYYSSYGSLDEVRAASLEINQQIAEESVVLMKNQDGALPLKDVRYVSVFGKAAADSFYVGGGSGTAENYYPQGDYPYTTIYDSLEAAGYSVNPALRSFYERKVAAAGLDGNGFSYQVVNGEVTFSGNRAKISDVNPDEFTGAVLDSYARYGDAAIIVLGRTGSEGGDKDMGRTREAFLAQAQYSGASDEQIAALENALDTDPAFAAAALRHGLALTWEEEQLIKHVAANFDTVIIVLNSPEQIELAWVEDGSLGDIDACLWVGHPGLNGFIAIGEVLSGAVNPSGRLVDIWQADMTKDPTYNNIMSNLQVEYGTTDYVYVDETDTDHLLHAVEYEEGIFYGYRYYETAVEEGFIDYDEAVVYPFGFGLSYTEFEKTLDSVEKKADEDGNAYYDIQVTVKNVGAVAGKEVVQIYYTAPYTPGGIEKAHVVLGAFDKTALLLPGQSETLSLVIYEQDMASYDYNDANANGHTGYELDGGDYIIKLMNNSHDVIAEETVAIEAQNFDTDRITGSTVDNLFSSTEDASYNSLYVKYDENGEALYDGKGGLDHDMVVMSRADFAGTFPTTPVGTLGVDAKVNNEGSLVKIVDEETYNDLLFPFTAGGTEDEAEYPWYDDLMTWYQEENGEETWTQGVIADPVINLSDMTGKDWDDPDWITFINQLSFEQLVKFPTYSGYWSISLSDELARRKGQSLESNGVALVDGQTLGVPFTEQADGPIAIKRQNTAYSGYDLRDVGIQWTSTMNIAATWNIDLVEIRGIMVGEEALALELDGWYGVAMNIHRSPWGGRNFEYFAEDPLLSGKIAAAEVIGLQSKGVVAFIKHFAVNHQDTNRGPALGGMSMPGSSDFGLITFVDEQTLREVYFKSFQMAVEEGGALGLMNSMNHIGIRGNSNNYILMTSLLRGEWGFEGYTVTDIVPSKLGSSYADPETLVRIGAELPLKTGGGDISGEWNADNNCVEINGQRNDVVWAALRQAVKRVMYVNANSSVLRNNLNLAAFGAKDKISVTIGVATKATVAVDAATFGTDDVIYTLTGNLPSGISFNQYTGAFSGTAVEDGSYPIVISLAADGGWIKDTKAFTLTVKNDMFETSGLKGRVNQDFLGRIDSESLREDGSEVTYKADLLPDGITLTEDGYFEGVPTAAGVYDVTVTASVKGAQEESGSGGSGGGSGGSEGGGSPSEYILHIVIEIAE